MQGPKLEIPRHIWQKIMHMVDNDDDCECSGLMQIELKDGAFVVADTVMTKQINSAGETELDPNGIGKAMFLFKDKPGALRGHWHSHVDMGVFWSSTDHEMIEQNAKHSPWFLHIVVNRKRQHLACLYIKEPSPMFLNNIEVEITDSVSEAVVAAWNKEYNEAVELKKFETVHYSGPGGYGYMGGGYPEIDGSRRVIPSELTRDEPEAPLYAAADSVDIDQECLDMLDDLELALEAKQERFDELEDLIDVDDGRSMTQHLSNEYWELREEIDRLERRIEFIKTYGQQAIRAGGKKQ